MGEQTSSFYPAGGDAEINAQIACDPDDFEAGPDWFRDAKTTAEIAPQVLERYLREKEALQLGKKDRLSILMDKDVLDYFRTKGGDWHACMNDALRKAIGKERG